MNSPINLAHLQEATEGDPELQVRLLNLFSAESRDNIEAMARALAAQDAPAWKANAHSLKGAAQNLGIDQLGSLAEEAEKSPPAPGLLEQIQQSFAQVEAATQELLKQL